MLSGCRNATNLGADMINIDTARSYSDETRLWRALENFGLHKARPVVVCNRNGRFTAVFGMAALSALGISAGTPPQAGFPVIN